MKNGKIIEFLKTNWRTFVYSSAIFGGILCGIWACSKSNPVSVDANRNRITIGITKNKTK